MTFTTNLVTLYALGFVMMLACMKTLLKLIRIWTGKDRLAGPFDFRKLPEFLGDDILYYVGGLMVLAIPTFIGGSGLPGVLAAILVGLQAFFLAAAFGLCGWLFAKIKDMWVPPSVPATTADVGLSEPPSMETRPPTSEAGPSEMSTRSPPG